MLLLDENMGLGINLLELLRFVIHEKAFWFLLLSC